MLQPWCSANVTTRLGFSLSSRLPYNCSTVSTTSTSSTQTRLFAHPASLSQVRASGAIDSETCCRSNKTIINWPSKLPLVAGSTPRSRDGHSALSHGAEDQSAGTVATLLQFHITVLGYHPHTLFHSVYYYTLHPSNRQVPALVCIPQSFFLHRQLRICLAGPCVQYAGSDIVGRFS